MPSSAVVTERVVPPVVALTVTPASAVPVALSVAVPVMVAAMCGALSMEERMSSLPSPHTLFTPAVPPQCVSSTSDAPWLRSARVSSIFPIRDGAADHRRATAPATCGVAIDVPDSTMYDEPGQVERTSTPGAEMFGFIEPSTSEGPKPEKLAISPFTS